jgi:hypothetical protein
VKAIRFFFPAGLATLVVVGLAAAVVTIAADAWYARRRWLR